MFNPQEEINIREYFYVIRKWKWMIIAIFVTIVLFAAIKSFRQVPIYQATVRLMIEKQRPDVTPFRDENYWEEWMDQEDFNSQQNILTSRTLAKQVMEKLGMLDQLAQSPPVKAKGFSLRTLLDSIPTLFGVQEPQFSETATATMREEQFVGGFLGMISVSPVRESRLLDVSVVSAQPEQAALIANTLAETYIEQDLELRMESAKSTVHWLVEEVENARKKVAESELALQQYKEEHAIISLEDRQNIVMQKLAQYSRAANEAKIERIGFEAQYREIQQYTPAQLATFPQINTHYTIQRLKLELVVLEGELSEAQEKYREKHPRVTELRSQVQTVRARIDAEMANILEGMAREYEMAMVKERDLAEALEEQKQEALELDQKAITYGILNNEVESNQWVYHSLLQKMKEMSISERVETSNIRIVDRAVIPNFPIAPRRRRSIAMAMIVSLMFGFTLAFVFEFLDNSIKTPEDMKQYLDIPFLGFIPKMAIKRLLAGEKSYQPEKVVAIAPRSIVSEAYRTLRTSVSFSAYNDRAIAKKMGTILLITSAEPSEGKSCTVANLGIAMAQTGRKTLIIDCDFRRPHMHQIFDISNEHGFADLLSVFQTRGKIRIKHTGIPNLDIFPCGKLPPNPSELLEAPFTKKMIEALATKYDTILLDSPPINSVTDPVILSKIAQGVVVVVRAGETKRDIVQRAKELLTDAGATILGGVINSVDIRKNKYYYYYAYHYPQYYKKDDIAVALV